MTIAVGDDDPISGRFSVGSKRSATVSVVDLEEDDYMDEEYKHTNIISEHKSSLAGYINDSFRTAAPGRLS